jgi:hypothetical protein
MTLKRTIFAGVTSKLKIDLIVRIQTGLNLTWFLWIIWDGADAKPNQNTSEYAAIHS